MGKRELILIAALSVTLATHAAEISWTVDLLDSLSDFSKEGNLVEAVNWGQAVNGTVNGIQFTGKGDDGNDNSTLHFSTKSDTVKVDERLFDGINWPSAAEAAEVENSQIMDSYANDANKKGGEVTVKLTGLIPERDYVVQLFIGDEGRGTWDGDWLTVDAGQDNELQSPYLLGSAHKTSTVFTGTFKADDTTQSFMLTKTDMGNGNETFLLNASQLRLLPEKRGVYLFSVRKAGS